MSLRVHLLSLFPEQVRSALSQSITGRAMAEGKLDLHCVQIRDFAEPPYYKVDDRLYGGGRGMLLRCEVLEKAFLSLGEAARDPSRTRRFFLSPRGLRFSQEEARTWVREGKELIFLCGHYEGVDQRFLDCYEFEEISLGDFVLTGGELPAAVMIDACARLLPGVLPASAAFEHESHYEGLLEEGQYTMPACWRSREVPSVLLSGHHAKIERYRRLASLRETLLRRPDLFDRASFSAEEFEELAEFLLSES